MVAIFDLFRSFRIVNLYSMFVVYFKEINSKGCRAWIEVTVDIREIICLQIQDRCSKQSDLTSGSGANYILFTFEIGTVIVKSQI